MANTELSVSPVLVEVAQRRVAEARAAGREPNAATLLIANAQVRTAREPVAVTDSATAQVTRATAPRAGGSTRPKRRR